MADYDLKNALKKLGDKRMNFVLLQGKTSDIVVVTPGKAGSSLLADLQKEIGAGKPVAKGIVYQGEGELVFATKQPPAPSYSKTLMAIFKEQKCGGYLPLVVRQLRADESEEAETEGTQETSTEPDSEAPVSPEDAKAEWDKLKAELVPKIKTAMANPALKEPLTKLIGEALAQEKAAAYPAAIAAFQKVAALIAGPAPSPTASTPPPAPPPPPAPEPAAQPAGPNAAALTATLNKLAPLIKQTLAAHPEAKEPIMRPVADFQAQLKANDLAAAQASLGKLAAALKAAAAGAGPAPTAPAPAPTAEPAAPAGEAAPEGAEAEFQKLFAKLNPSYVEAVQSGGQIGPEAEKLIKQLKFQWDNINDAMGNGDFAAALQALRPLENGALFTQIREAKALGGGPIAEGTVEKRKFLVTRFQKIPAEIHAELEKLRAAIEKNLPDEQAAELTSEMEDSIGGLVSEIQNEIDDAINAGDMSLIKGLKARVTSDPLIAHLLSNPFVSGTKFQTVITDALDEIEAKLAA